MAVVTATSGEQVVWDIGQVNENRRPGSPVFDREMDYNNNHWGIKWAKKNITINTDGSISYDSNKFVSDLFDGITSGEVIIKQADMHYVNKYTMKAVQNAFIQNGWSLQSN